MNLTPLFKNKNVALVGPSKCIIGSNFGNQIEAFDLVVRMNHQWPIAPKLDADLGQRMDILYHCCNPDFSVMRFAQPAFQETKIVFYEQGIQEAILLSICMEQKIPHVDITAEYKKLRQRLNTEPNTGLVAISHLLSFPINSLKLFGMTFFREAYYDGYLGRGAEAEHWIKETPPIQIGKHKLDTQFNYFINSLKCDPRLHIDEYSHKIIGA